MDGVGLTTVGRLLSHRQRETTAIYAHLDDRALHDAAAQAATVIAAAMGYKAAPPAPPRETADTRKGSPLDWLGVTQRSPDPAVPCGSNNSSPTRYKPAVTDREPSGNDAGKLVRYRGLIDL